MSDLIPLFVSIVLVIALVLLLSLKLKLSSRYERKPRTLNSWNAQDHGIDPTDDVKQ
jgi:hypothetical protein